MLNNNKTEFFIAGSRQSIQRLPPIQLQVGDSTIMPSCHIAEPWCHVCHPYDHVKAGQCYCFICELPTTQPLETTPLPGSRNKAPSSTCSNSFLSGLWQRPALWNNIKRTQTPSVNSEQICQIHILCLET